MPQRVQAAAGAKDLALPGGWSLNGGDEVVIPDAEWEQISTEGDLLLYLIDLGETTDLPDPVPSYRDMQRAVAGGDIGLAAQLDAHVVATTDVHGIPDTSNLAPDDIPDLTLIYENGLI